MSEISQTPARSHKVSFFSIEAGSMTPWDYITAGSPSSSVLVLALGSEPPGALDDALLLPAVAGVPPGSMVWSGPANIDPTNTLVTREVTVTFGPLPFGAVPVDIQGLALVDPGPPATVLMTARLTEMQQLTGGGAKLTITGPIVVVQ